MTMCISVLLALVVFLLLVSKILPPTSDTIPLIANYLLFTFVNNVVVIVFTVVIINWFFRTPRTHRMPGWVRVVFLNYLPRVILMKRPRHDERWGKKDYTIRHEAAAAAAAAAGVDATTNRDGSRSSVRDGPRGAKTDGGAARPVTDTRHLPGVGSSVRVTAIRSSLYGMSGGTENGCVADGVDAGEQTAQRTFFDSSAAAVDCDIPLTSETKKALDAVSFIAAHLKNEDDYSEVLDDWMYVASVIDRLQLYVFLAIIIAGTVGILIHAPHIFDFIDQTDIIKKILESPDGSPVPDN